MSAQNEYKFIYHNKIGSPRHTCIETKNTKQKHNNMGTNIYEQPDLRNTLIQNKNKDITSRAAVHRNSFIEGWWWLGVWGVIHNRPLSPRHPRAKTKSKKRCYSGASYIIQSHTQKCYNRPKKKMRYHDQRRTVIHISKITYHKIP